MKETIPTPIDLSPSILRRVVSRRDLLKIIGAGLFLTACGKPPFLEKSGPQEKFKLIESVDLTAPSLTGLTAERYAVQYDEIPVSFLTRRRIQSWIVNKKNIRAYEGQEDSPAGEIWWTSLTRRGSSFIGSGQLKPSGGFSHGVFFDGPTGKLYENVVPDLNPIGRTLNKSGAINREILGWPDLWIYGSMQISDDGKVLYNVRPGNAEVDGPRHVIIIDDVRNSSIIVIKDNKTGGLIAEILSKEGGKLLLSFGYSSKDEGRGTYLIDLNSLRVTFQSEIASQEPLLNSDGSLVYVNPGLRAGEDVGYVHDTNTGKLMDIIRWPTFKTAHEHFSSSDLNFIARKVMVFTAKTTTEDRWGIFVHTPEGIFYIHSLQKSLIPEYVADDGTIYTSDCVFKFENGIYQLSETSERNKFEVSIGQVSED